MHVIQKLFEPNYFFHSALKVSPSDFIQNMSQLHPSTKTVDKSG
jgi:hypothetical protein